ncbi:MAG TPA: 4Fe-4S binding protein [Clostridiaceae bacterium]|nr:4Fe-4S binding protein [Clostridiaceae bacterium]
MKRKIIKIDEEKCNGCGLCVNACHEGAIEIIDGKARLVGDEYCDGLGNCLPECPTGAIEIIEKDTVPFSEEAVQRKKLQAKMEEQDSTPLPCGCPGTAARFMNRNMQESIADVPQNSEEQSSVQCRSELRQWPVQLNLINPRAGYLDNADLLIAADCTAYAYANFHKDFIKGRITLIGCPKLDDIDYYTDKLTDILLNNDIKSITVVRMEVPCCSGIVRAVKTAMLNSQNIVQCKEVIISTDGEIIR